MKMFISNVRFFARQIDKIHRNLKKIKYSISQEQQSGNKNINIEEILNSPQSKKFDKIVKFKQKRAMNDPYFDNYLNQEISKKMKQGYSDKQIMDELMNKSMATIKDKKEEEDSNKLIEELKMKHPEEYKEFERVNMLYY